MSWSEDSGRTDVTPGRWSLEGIRTEANYWQARILSTAVDLDLFTWIAGDQKTPEAFASHAGGRAQVWEIFLDALCGLGLLRKRRGRYRNSSFALRRLTGGKASFLLPHHDDWNAWERLPALLRSGRRPRAVLPFQTDRRKTERLLLALHDDAKKIAPYLFDRVDFRRSRRLLDIGGGCGTFAVAFCRRYPGFRATVIEHPRTASLTRRVVKSEGLRGRVDVIAEDFLKEELPTGFDAVWLSNVLHGHAPAENRLLLSKIHRSLHPRGKLIVRDVFLQRHRTRPKWAALFSVCLLLHTPRGRCYTLDEARAWLRRAGFQRVRGPYRSSSLAFDPDSILIAEK